MSQEVERSPEITMLRSMLAVPLALFVIERLGLSPSPLWFLMLSMAYPTLPALVSFVPPGRRWLERRFANPSPRISSSTSRSTARSLAQVIAAAI